MTWELATFGTNSALNGALNSAFNAGNLVLLTGEQIVNSLMGAFPAPAVSTVVTGGAGANIGGLEGILNQTLTAGAELAGVL